MEARIFKPTRNVMQSGVGNTKHWKLEFSNNGSRFIEPLMGWTGSADMVQEINLWFETCDHAVAYAKKNNIPYVIEEPETRHIVPKSYADNFK